MFLCECGHSFENPRYCAGDRVPYGDTYASFGDYGPQKGDGTSDLAEGEQIKSTAEIISGWAISK